MRRLRTYSFGYDNLGRMTSASQPGHALSFSYDALGRQIAEAGPLATVSMAYDLAGRRTALTSSTGYHIAYSHLVTGEVSQIREGGGIVLASFGYDDLGRRTSLTRGNGTVTSYGYDSMSRLASLVQDLGSTAHDLNLTFSYNPASQITSNTRSNDIYAWTGHGNGTTSSTANGLNQLTQTGGTALTHDGRGNVTGIGAATYSYDAENRMIGATGAPGYLFYEPTGRLGHVYNGRINVYDGQALITEYNGGPFRRFVHGPGVDEPLVWYEGSGTSDKRYLHADERGSIVAVSDIDGNVVGINKYDEYGKPQGSALGRFGYTGQVWIPEIGLNYYKARMYHPGLGRFPQTDPIGYKDGPNIYNYAGGDPVNAGDPSGTAKTCTTNAEGETTCIDDPPEDQEIVVTAKRDVEASSKDSRKSSLAGVGMLAVGLAAADGPLPVLDVVAGAIIVGAGIALLAESLDNDQDDGGSESEEPADSDLTPVRGNENANRISRQNGYLDAHDAKKGRGGSRVNIYTSPDGRAWLWDGVRGSAKDPL